MVYTETKNTAKVKLKTKTYRHELKYETDRDKANRIRYEFEKVLQRDENAGSDGSYIVKSLYFETPYNDDYTDKELGVQFRQKIRLRSYGSMDNYKLEIKSKAGDVATKYSRNLTVEQAREISEGRYGCLVDISTAEALYIYHQLTTKVYRPLVTVIYRRYPLIHKAGNFRLTFDESLRFTASAHAMFSDESYSGVVTDKTIIEVKYDDFVPNWITDILLKSGVNAGENSKYAAAFRSIFD